MQKLSMPQNIIVLQNIIVPDQIGVLKRRCNILRAIVLSQPIGLRTLAAQMGVRERAVRNDIDFLVKQRLVKRNRSGIYVTPEGEDLLSELEQYLKSLSELRDDSKKNLQLA